MVKDPHLKMSEWAKQYGNLCIIHLGRQPALLISDPKLLREIFGTMAATGKFRNDTIIPVSQGPYGILNTEGKTWLEQRQFCMRGLKEFGYGSSRSMEPMILQGAEEVCDWILDTQKANSSQIVVLDNVLKQATVNALWTIVSGERVKLDDSEVGKLMQRFEVDIQYTVKTGLGFFPLLKHLAPGLSGYLAYDQTCKDIHNFIKKRFQQHKETYVEGERRDLIDMYIENLKSVEESDKLAHKSFQGEVGIKNSVATIVEIFIAGGLTTTVTLMWGLVYLAHNQQVQENMVKEVEDVVGRNRDISLQDKARMPYTDAVIQETLRLSSAAPMGLIHQLLEDLPVCGITFPKGLLLVPNMYHIHHNPDIWGDPEIFRPERFLTNAELKEHLVPFQAGRRQCLGEPLARDMLFIFLSKLIQQFHVKPVPNISEEDYMKCDAGILLLSQPYGLIMNFRNQK